MSDRIRIGIDVGGTNTDAVLLDGTGRILTKAKTPTGDDPAAAIERALAAVIPGDPSLVTSVSLGTTQALNALIKRQSLGRVAVLRLAAPATRSVPPFAGWPSDLRASVDGGDAIVRGGIEVDGRIHPLDHDEIRRALEATEDVTAVAVTGPFSLQDPSQELEAASLVKQVLGEVPVSLSHEVGGLGLLERENATIINASLGCTAASIIDGFIRAVAAHRLTATPFLSQNDGTMMGVERARSLPVLTIGSGPSNSIRGAVALTGVQDAIVIDVGGTSTDIGAIANGFPRESAVGVELGGIRTNFRMPDLISIAAGGGSVIDADGILGTLSVGDRLTKSALVFGGSTITLSDAAVAAGRATIGDIGLLGDRAWPSALAEADRRIVEAFDRMRLTQADVPIVAVGGGSVLLPDAIPGASTIVRPHHFDVANAVGAAIALVSGEAERIADTVDREAAITAATADARARAEAAGAAHSTLVTVWLEEVPLAYMDRPLSRFRVKVAGPPV